MSLARIGGMGDLSDVFPPSNDISVDPTLLLAGVGLLAIVLLSGGRKKSSRGKSSYVVYDKKTGKEIRRYRAGDVEVSRRRR